MSNTVIIKTKTLNQHFVGQIKVGRDIDGNKVWFVACTSCGGSHTKVNPLDAIDYKEKTKTKLVKKLRSLAKRGKYRISFS